MARFSRKLLFSALIVVASLIRICMLFYGTRELSLNPGAKKCINHAALLSVLKQHALELSNTKRSLASSTKHSAQLRHHIDVVHDILSWIVSNHSSTFTFNSTLFPNQILASSREEYKNQASSGVHTFIDATVPVIHAAKDSEGRNGPGKQEVCPEKYMGRSSLFAWPFFRRGFESEKCTDFVPIQDLVTVLLQISESSEGVMEVLKGFAKYYSSVRVIFATESPVDAETKTKISNLEVTYENEVLDGTTEASLWKKLVQKVNTPYVLIAPNLTLFDEDVNLERLVRVLSYIPQVVIAGGSYRSRTGHWDNACQQVTMKNWTATYRGGYYHSFNECLVCDFLTGPWMAKTKTLKSLDLDTSLGYGVFHDLFWRLKKRSPHEIAVSCPDVMFNIKSRDIRDEELVTFANKHEIHKMVEADGRVRWFGCRLGYPYTSPKLCHRPKGVGRSPADMENVADAIKFFMAECEAIGAFCEFTDGTLLGLLKLNAILPWDLDADLAFLASNFSAIEKMTPKLDSKGYKLVIKEREAKKIGGRTVHGFFALRVQGWKIDLFGFEELESHMLVSSGRPKTKMLFAGQWVNVMRNPGLYARNHYVHEIYRHQEHLLRYGRGDYVWGFYDPGKFYECPKKGHSACLDQYPADGSIPFKENCSC